MISVSLLSFEESESYFNCISLVTQKRGCGVWCQLISFCGGEGERMDTETRTSHAEWMLVLGSFPNASPKARETKIERWISASKAKAEAAHANHVINP